MTNEEIIADYPSLEKEDIKACLLYASRLSETKTIHKICKIKTEPLTMNCGEYVTQKTESL
jgi:hypothetical protein